MSRNTTPIQGRALDRGVHWTCHRSCYHTFLSLLNALANAHLPNLRPAHFGARVRRGGPARSPHPAPSRPSSPSSPTRPLRGVRRRQLHHPGSFDPDWPSKAPPSTTAWASPFVVKDKPISPPPTTPPARDGDADERARRAHHCVRAVADGAGTKIEIFEEATGATVAAVEPPGGFCSTGNRFAERLCVSRKGAAIGADTPPAAAAHDRQPVTAPAMPAWRATSASRAVRTAAEPWTADRRRRVDRENGLEAGQAERRSTWLPSSTQALGRCSTAAPPVASPVESMKSTSVVRQPLVAETSEPPGPDWH